MCLCVGSAVMVVETCGLRTGVRIWGIVSVCFLSHASLASHVCSSSSSSSFSLCGPSS